MPPRWRASRLTSAASATPSPRSRRRTAARDVHDRLLKIYDVDAGLVAETQRMVEYEAAAPATLEPLDRASQTLRRDLRRARTASSQAKALDRFGDTLARVSRRLDGLDVPALLQPAHESQLKRLASTRRLSRQLQSAVRAKDSRRVAKLLLRFRKSTQTRGLLRARPHQARHHRLHVPPEGTHRSPEGIRPSPGPPQPHLPRDRDLMKRLLLTTLLFLLAPATAHAATLTPSLKVDTNFAPLSGSRGRLRLRLLAQ